LSCPICYANSIIEIGIKNQHWLAKCPKCSCVFVNPVPSAEQLGEIYDDYLATDKYLKKLKKKTVTSVYKIFKLKKYLTKPQKNFLDVGCNIGATVRAAQIMGFNAMGIDLDSTSISKAKQLFTGCEFSAVSTFDLVEKQRKFDFIFCSEVIEHVPFPHEFVQSLFDLMADNAILYLTTPDTAHSRVPKDILSWKEVKPPEHIIYFNKKSLTLLLKKHGFEITKSYWNHRANLRVVCKKKVSTANA